MAFKMFSLGGLSIRSNCSRLPMFIDLRRRITLPRLLLRISGTGASSISKVSDCVGHVSELARLPAPHLFREQSEALSWSRPPCSPSSLHVNSRPSREQTRLAIDLLRVRPALRND